MTMTVLQHQLSTPEGFARAVSPKKTALTVAIWSLIAAAACVVINLLQLGEATRWNWRFIGMLFFNAEAIEFTGYRSGRAEMMRFISVYAPIVLVPLAIVLLIVHATTRARAAATLYENFRARGWVGRQVLPGLVVRNGNATTKVALISHPGVPDAEFDAFAHGYAMHLASLDKKAMKAASAAATGAKVLAGVSASALAQGAPQGVLAAPAAGKGAYVVVVPPSAAGDKLQIRPIKESAAS